MDALDKLFSKIKKEQAPSHLAGEIFQRVAFKEPKKSFFNFRALVVPLAVFALVLGGVGYGVYRQNYQPKNLAPTIVDNYVPKRDIENKKPTQIATIPKKSSEGSKPASTSTVPPAAVSAPSSYSSGNGATYVSEEGRIQVVYPKGGENLEVGKTYDIQWANYFGSESLTIALQSTSPDGKISTKIIASNVSATTSYEWTVGYESTDDKYKIEIYPEGGRELVGRSKDYFTISSE